MPLYGVAASYFNHIIVFFILLASSTWYCCSKKRLPPVQKTVKKYYLSYAYYVFFKLGRHAMILILMLVFITNTLGFLVALLKLPGFMLSYPILHYHIDFYANFNFKVSS